MRKPNKKGFTIVELVIVIAVVAILAAVLIPTFVNVVNKANVSNDTALVKNINLTLAAEEITDGKPATMHEALEMAERGGFDVSKLTPRSSGDIVWDEDTNRFALINGNDTVFSENDKKINPSSKVWKFADNASAAENESVYSVYLKDGVTADSLTVSTGIDVGNNTVSSLTYNGGDSAKEVVIRTNNANTTLNVNGYVDNIGKGDTITHYGDCGKVVASVAMHCYYENGKTAYIELKKGKVVANENASVEILFANPESGATIEVSTNGGTVKNAYSVSEVNNAGNVTITTDTKDNIETKAQEILNIDTGRVVKLGDTATYLSLTELKDAWNNTEDKQHETVIKTAVFNIVADVDMKGIVWSDGIGSVTNFTGTINGNNHTISNFTFDSTSEEGGLIQNCAAVTIKDLSFENVSVTGKEKVGTVIGYAHVGKVVLENVKVLSGTVNSEQYSGGIVGKSMADIYFKNCINNADITAKYGPTGGSHAMVAAGIMANTQGGITVIFDNCTNNGSITSIHNNNSKSTVGGGIFGYSYQPKDGKIGFIGCVNNGSLDVQGTGALYSGDMLGGWGETDVTPVNIYVKDCKAGNKECDSGSVGKYDETRAEALLTVSNGNVSKVYYMGSNGLDEPINTNGGSEVWKEITISSAVAYDWDAKTLTFTYTV